MEKAPDAFRTISVVADDLDIPQHVLRFWESRFTQIRPMKRAGGRRYYRSEDVDLLRGIRHLLYGEGYTIRGVQRILKEHGIKFVQDAWHPGAPQPIPALADDEDTAADEGAIAEDKPDAGGRAGRLSPSGAAHAEGARRMPRLDDPKVARSGRERAPVVAEQRGGKHLAVGFERDDLRKLQAALHELGECRRLLDAALD